MIDFTIRHETADDIPAIRALHLAAFGEDTGRLADELRHAGDAVISLVAEQDGHIVGHVLFSRIGAPMRALTLAPVGVRPDMQKCGIGSALIKKGLEEARKDGWDAVFVLGAPAYYMRFGFHADPARVYNCSYGGKDFMMQSLTDRVPKEGQLVFPEAFAEDIREHIARRRTTGA